CLPNMVWILAKLILLKLSMYVKHN
ncbi:hypothetical protein, partial [uncultured Gammaproteobacteria bacterium]